MHIALVELLEWLVFERIYYCRLTAQKSKNEVFHRGETLICKIQIRRK